MYDGLNRTIWPTQCDSISGSEWIDTVKSDWEGGFKITGYRSQNRIVMSCKCSIIRPQDTLNYLVYKKLC